MGKRKSSAKPPPKKAKPKLETTFSCPFCNAEKAVGCELHRAEKVGVVKCTQCNQQWSTTIHELSEPIDVYSEWIDACEEAQTKEPEEQGRERGREDPYPEDEA